ncbi:MAG: Rho-binding antiterminator [Methylococcales bacterium]|nr:Rho-binding antiterminator [Methylococcales bacterium]
MNTPVIDCHLHDYLEVACVYRYQVRVTLKNGRTLTGTACDLVSEQGQEFLLLDSQTRVALLELTTLDVLTPGAQFETVRFDS